MSRVLSMRCRQRGESMPVGRKVDDDATVARALCFRSHQGARQGPRRHVPHPRGLALEPADSGAQSFSRHPGTRRASAHVVAAPEGAPPKRPFSG
jgi:hypothetical protein